MKRIFKDWWVWIPALALTNFALSALSPEFRDQTLLQWCIDWRQWTVFFGMGAFWHRETVANFIRGVLP